MEKPRMPIRRFDVFAEFNRLEALEKGMSDEEAAGYGLWVAKVVASGGGRRALSKRPPKGGEQADDEEKESDGDEKEAEKRGPRFRTLGDEEQTDELFDREVVRRMGEGFYRDVFRPAIEEAYRQGRGYTEIRDTIRKDWKP
jgi:hypothetical protein